MAGGNTAADNITLNLGSGGANIATDYLLPKQPITVCKIGIGGDGSLDQMLLQILFLFSPMPEPKLENNSGWGWHWWTGYHS